MIEQAFGKNYRSLAIQYSRENVPLGTGGALRQALKLVPTEIVLAMNGDSYCNVDLADFCSQHLAAKHKVSLVGSPVDDVSRYGTLEVDSQGKITAFIEKQSSKNGGWINSGIYLFPKKLLSTEPEEIFISLEKEILPRWIDKGIFCYQKPAEFIDIGLPFSYQEAGDFFKKMEGKK